MDSFPPTAWEPVTPRGVAAFARASTARLWLVQFIVSCVVATSVVWLMKHACFPTIREAIHNLPDTGVMRGQRLDWNGDSPMLLAEGRILAFSVDLEHTNDVRSPAHVEVEFGRTSFFTYSLLGYAEWGYPAGWIVAANRPELEPWWGSREPAVLALSALTVVVTLFVIWFVLAVLYTAPVWLIAFFANRDLKLKESWRLANAALMPGALVMALAIFVYATGWFDLIALAFVLVAHVVLGWIYLPVSVIFLPRMDAIVRKNPFVPEKPADSGAE